MPDATLQLLKEIADALPVGYWPAVTEDGYSFRINKTNNMLEVVDNKYGNVLATSNMDKTNKQMLIDMILGAFAAGKRQGAAEHQASLRKLLGL